MTISLFSQNLKNDISRVKNTSLTGSREQKVWNAFWLYSPHSWDFLKIKENLTLNGNNGDNLYYRNCHHLILWLFPSCFLAPFLILGKGILLIWIQYDISEIFNTILTIPALTRLSRHNVCISVKLPLPYTEFRCWKNATGYFEGPWSKLQPYERRFSFPLRQIWVFLKICLADVILKAKVISFPSQGGSCY